MDILVKRIAKKEGYTIGRMYVDGKYFCDTLEDTDRGIRQDEPAEIEKKKIHGKTAIPTGEYQVDLNQVSHRFGSRSWAWPYKGKVPRLLGVPGFAGVLIHPGNTAEDTSGCILIGENKVVGKVVNSVKTFHKLMEKMNGKKVFIKVE